MAHRKKHPLLSKLKSVVVSDPAASESGESPVEQRNELKTERDLAPSDSTSVSSSSVPLNRSLELITTKADIVTRTKDDFLALIADKHGNSYAAVKHSEVAAEKGSSIAALRLAQRYEKGDGVQRDYEKSFYYYQQAMSFGDPTGAGKVAHCYELGKGVEQNVDIAGTLYKQLVKRSNAEDWVVYRYGGMVLDGRGCERNVNKGLRLLDRAVGMGYAPAYNLRGFCWENGIAGGTHDVDMALTDYFVAHSMGYTAATFSLAWVSHFEGHHYSKPPKAASPYDLIQRSANKGFAPAIFIYAHMHLSGEGVRSDAKVIQFTRAGELFLEAARMHYPRALYAMYHIYRKGKCSQPKDYRLAMKMLKEAANLWDLKSMRELEYLYSHSNDYVRMNEEKAEFWRKMIDVAPPWRPITDIATFNLSTYHKYTVEKYKKNAKAPHFHQMRELYSTRFMEEINTRYHKVHRAPSLQASSSINFDHFGSLHELKESATSLAPSEQTGRNRIRNRTGNPLKSVVHPSTPSSPATAAFPDMERLVEENKKLTKENEALRKKIAGMKKDVLHARKDADIMRSKLREVGVKL